MENVFYYNLDTQFENTGDLLINQVLIGELSRFGVVIIDDRNTPQEFLNSLIVNENIKKSSDVGISGNFSDYLLKQTVNNETGYLVFVPGVLYRYGFIRALKSLKQIYKHFKLKRKGYRLMRIGISIKDLKHFNGISEAINSTYFHAYLLRDRKSFVKAQKHNLSNIGYIPDLAWAYKPNVIKPSPQKNIDKVIILSFRSNDFGSVHDSTNLDKIILAIDNLLSNSPFQNMLIKVTYQVLFDRAACIQIFNFFKNKYNIVLVDELLSIEQACKIYSEADFVFSNRLHVLMLGIVNRTLSIPLLNHYSNDKIIGIFKDNNLEETIMYYDKEEVNNVRTLEQIIHDQDLILEKYRSRVEQNNAEIQETIRSIINDSVKSFDFRID